ncbi:MAG: Smr/MutS family protein [Treponema sp.]|jgi:DNA-nicking Smr family endonuclease|nr:Smr/MutS family protein [Treponema sp.]
MDFGSILDEWDRRVAGSSAGKTGPAALPESSPGEKQRLQKKNIYGGDAGAEDPAFGGRAVSGENPRVCAAERRRRLLKKKPDAVLDLHNLTRDEAWTVMDGFFRNARNQRLEKLLIIHGKGNHSEGEAVLKRTSREFIERCPFAGESGHSGVQDGGTGSTWVFLKEAVSKPAGA